MWVHRSMDECAKTSNANPSGVALPERLRRYFIPTDGIRKGKRLWCALMLELRSTAQAKTLGEPQRKRSRCRTIATTLLLRASPFERSLSVLASMARSSRARNRSAAADGGPTFGDSTNPPKHASSSKRKREPLGAYFSRTVV